MFGKNEHPFLSSMATHPPPKPTAFPRKPGRAAPLLSQPPSLVLELRSRAFSLLLSFPFKVVLDDYLQLTFFQVNPLFTNDGSARPQASPATPITDRVLNSKLENKHLKPVISESSSTRVNTKNQLISQMALYIKLRGTERNTGICPTRSVSLKMTLGPTLGGGWTQCPPLH